MAEPINIAGPTVHSTTVSSTGSRRTAATARVAGGRFNIANRETNSINNGSYVDELTRGDVSSPDAATSKELLSYVFGGSANADSPAIFSIRPTNQPAAVHPLPAPPLQINSRSGFGPPKSLMPYMMMGRHVQAAPARATIEKIDNDYPMPAADDEDHGAPMVGGGVLSVATGVAPSVMSYALKT